MKPENLSELPVKETPDGPPHCENVRADRANISPLGDTLILSEVGTDGAYIASTVTVADYQP